MPKPNMSPEAYQRWAETPAAKQWKRNRDQARYSGYVVRTIKPRTMAVLKGTASESDRQKVERFISRHKKQDAGQRILGSGQDRVSKRTAALRWWGFDPTGRFR